MFATVDEAIEAVLAEGARWDGYRENYDGGEYVFSPEGGFGADAQWCGLAREHDFRFNGLEPGGDVIPRLFYTPSAAQDFADRGMWVTDGPQRGDLVLFNWEGYGPGSGFWLIDHIGVCLDPSNWPYSIVTREGNIDQGDGIPSQGIFTRSSSVISGFGRPNWEAAVSGTGVPTLTDPEEDPVLILKNANNGWHLVAGSRLVPLGGPKDFNIDSADVDKVVYASVSDKQLAGFRKSLAA